MAVAETPTCPMCKKPLRAALDGSREALVCLTCQKVWHTNGPVRKAPGGKESVLEMKPEMALEHEHQSRLIATCRENALEHPCLALIFAIPNGGSRGPKAWRFVEGKKMREEGVLPGVPDLFLPVAMGGYHGMFIEMKRHKEKPTANQYAMLQRLGEQGYLAVWYDDWREAWSAICNYLGIAK